MKKIILSTLGITLLAIGANANAGEGGIAGAVAIHTSAAGVLNWTSSSVAIGKSGAYSGAVTTTGATATATSFAVGSGGSITSDATTGFVSSVGEETAAGLAISQTNSLTDSSVNINATTADTTGTVGP